MDGGLVATVAEAFRAELGVECGPDDSFFRLGGDSLRAAHVLARLNREHGVNVPFAEVFRESTPAAVARLIERGRAATRTRSRSITAVARRRRREWFPLALSQEGLYAMNAATGGAGLFNNVGVLRVTGDIDPAALRSAVDDTLRRQSALRLVFGAENGRPVQRFADELPEVTTCDLRGRGEPALDRRVRRERLTGFDLHAGPPVRLVLARMANDDWALVTTFHHIVFDGMSQRIFVDDLVRAYAFRTGEGTAPAPLARDYGEFAEWQRDTLRGERLEADLDAIRATLGSRPRPPLAPTTADDNTFLARARRFTVSPEHTAGLRARAVAGDTTLFTVAAGAMLDFVARRTREPKPAVAIQVANRGAEGAEEMVGCFANSVVLGLDRPETDDPAEHVLRTGEALADALRLQEMPLEAALTMLDERGLGVAPHCMPQVGFTLQPPRGELRELPGGTVRAAHRTPLGDMVDPTSFALVMELFAEDGGLDGVTHHRLADWPADSFAAAETEISASFARFGATGSGGA